MSKYSSIRIISPILDGPKKMLEGLGQGLDGLGKLYDGLGKVSDSLGTERDFQKLIMLGGQTH